MTSIVSRTPTVVQHAIVDWEPVAVRRHVQTLLDPSCFASWLHAQPPNRPLYDDDRYCVLGTYLHDCGFVHITIGPTDCFLDGLLAPIELPRWARAFIRAIDTGEAVCRDEVTAVFEEVLQDFADRDRPQALEDWQESRRTVA